MGREIRKVPPYWEHPRDRVGHFIPLNNQTYDEAAQEWIEEFKAFVPDKYCKYYWEYTNPPIDCDDYLPFNKQEGTWYQVYETVSEGTPVTPPFETEEELINHLIEFGESLYPEDAKPIDPESARRFVLNSKWCPSFEASSLGIKENIEIC